MWLAHYSNYHHRQWCLSLSPSLARSAQIVQNVHLFINHLFSTTWTAKIRTAQKNTNMKKTRQIEDCNIAAMSFSLHRQSNINEEHIITRKKLLHQPPLQPLQSLNSQFDSLIGASHENWIPFIAHTHTPHNNSLHVISLTGTVIMICNSRFFAFPFIICDFVQLNQFNVALLIWSVWTIHTIYFIIHTSTLWKQSYLHFHCRYVFSMCYIGLYRDRHWYATAVHCSFLSLAVFSDKREVNKIARHQYTLVDISSRIFFRFGCFAAIIIVSCYCVTFSQWAFFQIDESWYWLWYSVLCVCVCVKFLKLFVVRLLMSGRPWTRFCLAILHCMCLCSSISQLFRSWVQRV